MTSDSKFSVRSCRLDSEEGEDELEPLFDYDRVQPIIISDDDSSDSPPPNHSEKRQKCSTSSEKVVSAAVVVVDDEEDWLPPPPKADSVGGSVSQESSILLELRTTREELALLTSQSVDEVFRVAEESARRELHSSVGSGEKVEEQEPLRLHQERKKIVVSIQDKEGLKQFRIYKDEEFENLFKMYAEKVEGDLEKLVFCFDGDKVSPTTTPDALGLEDDDMLEVYSRTC